MKTAGKVDFDRFGERASRFAEIEAGQIFWDECSDLVWECLFSRVFSSSSDRGDLLEHLRGNLSIFSILHQCFLSTSLVFLRSQDLLLTLLRHLHQLFPTFSCPFQSDWRLTSLFRLPSWLGLKHLWNRKWLLQMPRCQSWHDGSKRQSKWIDYLDHGWWLRILERGNRQPSCNERPFHHEHRRKLRLQLGNHHVPRLHRQWRLVPNRRDCERKGG